MKLDIIVPHYREPWRICRYLFDTIATQRGVSFEDIRVILVNDGNDILFGNMEKALYTLCGYPFAVDYIVKEHGGVSAARNEGLDGSDADYVMFCDCDDGFLNNYALHAIFEAMQEGFDLFMADFVEEAMDSEEKLRLVTHKEDLTFLHGKVYRRAFLAENNLRFDDSLTVHEDGYFNMMAYSTLQFRAGSLKKTAVPLYIWRWNDNSVVRADLEDFVLKTYADVMKARVSVCRKQKARKMGHFYRATVCMTVLNAYYDFQKPRYYLKENEEHLRKAEQAFRAYWMEFRDVFLILPKGMIAEVAKTSRANAVKNGMLMERQTLAGFLAHIENEVDQDGLFDTNKNEVEP